MAGLGFAAAEAIRPGDKVFQGGLVRTVREISHCGKDWPYFTFEGDTSDRGNGRWVSWQVCGAVDLAVYNGPGACCSCGLVKCRCSI